MRKTFHAETQSTQSMNEQRSGVRLVRPAKAVSLGSSVRRFELKTALTPSGAYTQALAYLLAWTGADYEIDEASEFIVYDISGLRRGRAHTDTIQGTRGRAIRVSDVDRWEIIELDHQARWIEFVVNDAGGFATTDASVTVDGITYHDGYDADPEITTVYNKSASSDYIFEGDDDDRGIALYDPLSGQYTIAGMEKASKLTTQTVVTDIQVDGANEELEKKTITITVAAKGAESGWTVFHTGDTCP